MRFQGLAVGSWQTRDKRMSRKQIVQALTTNKENCIRHQHNATVAGDWPNAHQWDARVGVYTAVIQLLELGD